MTDPLGDKRPEDVLLDILGTDTYCTAQVDYLIAGYLARDEFGHELLEGYLLARVAADRKRKALSRILKHTGLNDGPPWAQLVPELEQLGAFRDRVAHSQPDHGNVLRRLRRIAGRNDVWEISHEELRAQWNRAIACQSQVVGLAQALAARPDGLSVHIGQRGVVSTPVEIPEDDAGDV